MRILIASDLHGALDSAAFLQKKASQWHPDLCLMLGDYLYHGPRNPLPMGYTPKDVARMLGELPVPVLAIRGNCDAEVDEMLLPFPLTDKAWVQADHLQILASHGHRYGPQTDFADLPAGTVVLTGHTHIPMAESRLHVHCWNPGSLTLPKQGYPRSYALYDAGTFQVLDMEDRVIMQQTPLS